MKLIAASNNQGKIREFKAILEPFGYEVISQKEAGIVLEVEETGETFRENAYLKAKAVYERCHEAVIADDSGLEVDALGGRPGVYSHRFAGENATDEDRCRKLLSEMEEVSEEKRTARFVSAICMLTPDGKEIHAMGTCEGMIGDEMRGENGFGYDPLFWVNGVSFAEMSSEEKNKISHRGKALQNLEAMLKTQ